MKPLLLTSKQALVACAHFPHLIKTIRQFNHDQSSEKRISFGMKLSVEAIRTKYLEIYREWPLTGKQKPASVAGEQRFAKYYKNLQRNSPDWKILSGAISDLEQNAFAGSLVPRKLWPKEYIKKFEPHNLYVYRCSGGNRITYTLLKDNRGLHVRVLEYLSHGEYEKRFGYD